MGITYLVVRPFPLKFHITFFYGFADVSNRILFFLVAVITYFWSVSNLGSRIVIGSILVFVFSLLVGCMWTIWEPSNGLGVWLDASGLCQSVSAALRASHVKVARLWDGILSFRGRSRPVATDNGNGNELAGPRDSVTGGTV